MNYTTPKSPVKGQTYNETTSEFENDAQDAAKEIKSSFADAKDSALKTAKSLSSKVHKLFDTASDEFTHVSGTVTKEIRTNPVQSTVIALGVGYVLGRLMKR